MEISFQDTLNLILKASNEGIWDWVVGDDDVFYSSKVFDFLGYEYDQEIPNMFMQVGAEAMVEDSRDRDLGGWEGGADDGFDD